MSDHLLLRASVGKGFRSPNVLAENNNLLASNRIIHIDNGLKMEEAWNYGVSAQGFINLFGTGLLHLRSFYRDSDSFHEIIPVHVPGISFPGRSNVAVPENEIDFIPAFDIFYQCHQRIDLLRSRTVSFRIDQLYTE